MARWKFERRKDFDALYKLQGTTPEPHEGYFRHNDGSFVVTDSEGEPIAVVQFKGKAKRGQAWMAPDAEGMANAHLIAAAPELLEALRRCVNHLQQIEKRDFPDAEEKMRRFNSTATGLAAIAKAEGR